MAIPDSLDAARYVPVPLIATVCVPSPPPALILKIAAGAPVAVGENDTLIVQLLPSAMEVLQVLVLE